MKPLETHGKFTRDSRTLPFFFKEPGELNPYNLAYNLTIGTNAIFLIGNVSGIRQWKSGLVTLKGEHFFGLVSG